ncbi:MAG: CHAT domain-containing protein [Acidobacteria bacterium]|nr:CHAT domain-containing protein [Acidobacteriota bacterium]
MARKNWQRYWQYCSANGRAIFGLALSLCALSGVEAAVTSLCAAQTIAAVYLAQDALPLEPGKPIEREIAVGESHFYQIALSAGQYLHAEIEQYGIDVAVTLFDPAGEKPLYFTDWEKGAESAHWIAETAGSYRLKIEAEPGARQNPTGRYQVRIAALRPAQPSDHYSIAARQAFKAAEELRNLEPAAALLQAREKFEESLRLWRLEGDRRWEAKLLWHLTVTDNTLGEYQRALENGEQALALWRATGESIWEGTTLLFLGEAYHYLSEYQQAIDIYHQTLPLWRAEGLRIEEAWALNNIGSACNALGDRQQALDYYAQSLRVYQSLGTHVDGIRGQGIALTNTGGVYAALGQTRQARDYLEQALPHWRAVNDQRGEGRVLHRLGEISVTAGEARQALDYYAQALTIWRALGHRFAEAATLHGIGDAHLSLGEQQPALDHLRQALELRRNIGDRRGQAQTLSSLAAIAHQQDEHEQALELCQQALTLQRAVGDRAGEAHTRYQLARVERARGQWDEARRQIEAALTLIERARANLLSQELRSSYLTTVRDCYEFYIDLLMQLHERQPRDGLDAEALRASERARARSLLEMLAEARAEIRQGADPQLIARERSLQQQLNAKAAHEMRLRRGLPTPEQLAAVEKEIVALTAAYDEAQTQIRAASPRYAALTQSTPPSAAEIQQQLDEDTLLLEYALGEERSYLWSVTHSKLTSHILPKRVEIEAAAERVYGLLTARNQRRAGETSQHRRARIKQADLKFAWAATALSRMLLGPVSAQLGNRRLVIVAHGALQFIPFATLPEPKDGRAGERKSGRIKANPQSATRNPQSFTPLIVNHEIVHLPSASVLALLRRDLAERSAAPKTIAVLADPVFSPDDERVHASAANAELRTTIRAKDWRDITRALTDMGYDESAPLLPRLQGTEWEAKQILARVPGDQKLAALGFAANRETATSPVLSQYRILHFATHALINNAHPELSGLVLSLVDEQGREQDGFLRAHEIFNLKLPAELVVLSACQTGLGKVVKGEGIVGLTRSFMYAGAPRVVVSLWSVRDQEAAELMTRFYERLLGSQKMSAAAALRAAQVKMWRAHRAAPYYWAPFAMQGEWR